MAGGHRERKTERHRKRERESVREGRQKVTEGGGGGQRYRHMKRETGR